MTRDTVVLASIASALLVAAYGGGDSCSDPDVSQSMIPPVGRGGR